MKKSQTVKTKKILSALLLMMLTAAMAFSAVGCGKNTEGETEKEFVFEVVTASGETKTFNIKTKCQKVGDALVDRGLIDGDDGPYGLYVKTVDGETHDYNEDGIYWSFYENGSYAVKGVDITDIEDGIIYSFRAEKG